MASLLIAGYGFLGKSLEREFSRSGWSVKTINRSGSHGAVPCDISSAECVAEFSGAYDLVIHCAASGGGGQDAYRKVYLAGSRNLLARFPEARHVFTSSTSVYAQEDHSVVTEASPAEPETATGRILRETEKLILASGGIVARLSALYGPHRCHVLKNFLNGTARLDGEGERIMNFIHRDDAARALCLIATQPPVPTGEIFNLTSEPQSQREVYSSLATHFGKAMPPAADDPPLRKRGGSSKQVSNAKLRSLGWVPKYRDFLALALECGEFIHRF